MENKINRRKFFADTALSAAGIVLGSNLMGCASTGETGSSSINIMEEVKKYRKIDTHIHINLFNTRSPEELVNYADRLGVDRMIISRPIVDGVGTPDEFIEYNNMVLRAMKQYPGRFLGQMTLNPIYQKESLEEIKRCVDQGMVALKVFVQVKINDPLFYPVIEKLIDLKMITLMHAECQLGVGGYRMKYEDKTRQNSANVSIPEDFVDVAKRYPEAMLQFAHIGGGGDWEYECKLFKDYPNIYVDTSGSNNEENMIDFAVKHLGEDRLFFGSDNAYYQAVGKILASRLTDTQKRKILFENYNNILRKGGNNVV